jgi:hypothetical protein
MMMKATASVVLATLVGGASLVACSSRCALRGLPHTR